MTGSLPPEAFAAALAGLERLGPKRLRVLLARLDPAAAWRAARAGVAFSSGDGRAGGKEAAAGLAEEARCIEPAEVWARCQQLGVGVTILGSASYPAVLAADSAAPAVLFHLGDMGVLDGPRAAIVGTRNATATGCDMAAELGRQLAGVGVRVVSGLARGVDGWAHRGALDAQAAPPVGVVGSGLDVVYPSHHHQLWHDVATRGVLLSEVPPGAPPKPFRFPARNRIIAALADVLVVVESRATGGSMLTVEEASRRGITVMAVPGSVRNRAADGTNHLIADGATPVTDVDDVLIALGLDRLALAQPRRDSRSRPRRDDIELLGLFGGEPIDIDRLVGRSGRSLLEVAVALGRLESAGWIIQTGAWFEAVP